MQMTPRQASSDTHFRDPATRVSGALRSEVSIGRSVARQQSSKVPVTGVWYKWRDPLPALRLAPVTGPTSGQRAHHGLW